jgi:hypothetical protein
MGNLVICFYRRARLYAEHRYKGGICYRCFERHKKKIVELFRKHKYNRGKAIEEFLENYRKKRK